jgi:hypothetical protein
MVEEATGTAEVVGMCPEELLYFPSSVSFEG